MLGNILIALYKDIWLISKSRKNDSFLLGFSSVIKGPHRNPILGKILISVYKEI